MTDISAGARIRVVVEVQLAAVYGKGWTFEQIQKDAAETAIARVRKLLDGEATVIGDPKVTVVWANEAV